MEKYVKAQMEVIEFEAEDVITTSGGEGTIIGGNTGNAPEYGGELG